MRRNLLAHADFKLCAFSRTIRRGRERLKWNAVNIALGDKVAIQYVSKYSTYNTYAHRYLE